IVSLVGEEKTDQFLQIEFLLRNATARRSNICGIERRVPGVASKNPEDANTLVRAYCSALPVDGFGCARDGGGKTNAVLGVADIIVHRLRDGDDFHPNLVQLRRVTECIV